MSEARTRMSVRSGPGRLSAADSERLPDRLLDAATELFSANGFSKTSMERIARVAGASTKTIYSRYANKEAILAAVVQRLLDRAVAAGKEELASKTNSDDPHEFLTAMGHHLAELSAARQAAGLNRLIMAEAYQIPALARLFIDLHERAILAVSEPLARFHAQRLLPNLPDSRMAATHFIEMATSIPRIRAMLGKPHSTGEAHDMVRAAVNIFLHGCGVR